jgi:hypothetical protein
VTSGGISFSIQFNLQCGISFSIQFLKCPYPHQALCAPEKKWCWHALLQMPDKELLKLFTQSLVARYTTEVDQRLGIRYMMLTQGMDSLSYRPLQGFS